MSYAAELDPTFVMPQAAIFPSVTKPTSLSGASSFDSILEQCHDLISDRVSDTLSEMLEKADDALAALGRQSNDPEKSKLYEVTRNTVLPQRDAIVAQFRMRFLGEFQERVNRVKKIGEKFAMIDVSSLEPVAEASAEESLKFDAMASRLRQYCEEELYALDQRVGVLVGDADLQSENNPFTPQAIVDAYKHACGQVEPNADMQMVLLKLFDDYVLDEIRRVYKAVNELLIKNSILPKLRFSVGRGKDSVKSSSGVPGRVDQAPGNESMSPVGTNVLEHQTNTNLGGDMHQVSTMSLDIMAILFGELFDDPKIPIIVKGLIGRLQIPMLKLVIADKSFFSRKSHPARLLLDELGEFSAHLPVYVDESDPVYQKLESILRGLIDGSDDDSSIFDDMRKQLESLSGEMNGGDEQDMPPSPNRAEQEEKLALAKRVAQAEITARMRGKNAPRLIIEFLTQQWVRLLVVLHFKEGEKSEAWKNALKTVDLLIWSGTSKETAEERRKMVTVMPMLLKSLAFGLAYAGIDHEIRVRFFADLRKLHAGIIGRSAQLNGEQGGEALVIENGPDEAATDVDPQKSRTAEQAVTGDATEKPETVSMREKLAMADTGHEMKLAVPSTEAGAAAIAELANAAMAKTAVPGEKLPTTDPAPATPEPKAAQEATPAEPAAQDAAADDAALTAHSLPPLEFEVGLLKSGEQNVPPVDIESMVNSLPSLEFETEPGKAGGQGAATTETAPDAQSPVPKQSAEPAAAQTEAQEAADRVSPEKSEPEPDEGTPPVREEPSAQLAAEMDEAMEATRTMFSDVDRFIILGQVQNAISLLDLRTKRRPADRDSWIKLMAIYRDTGKNEDFYRTHAAFLEQFRESEGA